MHTTHITPLEFDSELVSRHDGHGPRYTSYPTADRFAPHPVTDAYVAAIKARNAGASASPLSLYVHIPFCDTVCYYCACNKIATRHKSRADDYLDDLEREIAMIRRLFADKPVVSQLHFGGGTPTFLTNDQMCRLLDMLHDAFDFASDAECSIEIDPRRLQEGALALLREYGFNRMSIGVQDVDERVQKAINRIQPTEVTHGVLEQARELGFRSINMDLIYGLPYQDTVTMARTLETVVNWRPDRIALYSYAHLPERFMPQRRIDTQKMPGPKEKLAMLKLAVTTLLDAGYVYIGMDHFALPDDELAQALDQGTLQRNFQGYSTRADCDLIALGVSAISRVGHVYAQNARTVEEYAQSLDRGELPLIRGLVMNRDDEVRRDAIHSLLCQSELDLQAMSHRWEIDAGAYFATEIESLADLERDGLVTVSDELIQVTPKGRFLARVVAMRFDKYLRAGTPMVRYSKVI
ncbi:oxygen-independent coproporphyrinogen III oxidase [Orrella marina]|uniref:Coproporphyrinogen-III oxidase n=1 Tax=Orrella marina TaxID=2163011 RepID=A0A2R4XJX7_9BURK|nr:oxygen-independent coproporphyrinogen III oxidase [Orrella marina]AWB34096.1 oxygen-independent coproporphyrinogen III oxidase [Orrella marina]